MSDAPKHPKSRSKVYPAVVRRDLRKYGIHIPHEMGGKGATWSFPSTEPQHTSFVCSCWSHDLLLGPKGSRPFAISAERAAGQWRLCWCLQAGAMVCHGGKGRGSSHWYDWVDGLFSDKHHLHKMQGFEILVSQQRKLNVGRSWLWTGKKMENLQPGTSNWMLMVEGWNPMQSRKWICKSCKMLRRFQLARMASDQTWTSERHVELNMLATSMAVVAPSLYAGEVSRVWIWLTCRSSRVGADQERLVRWVARLEFEAPRGPAVVFQALQGGNHRWIWVKLGAWGYTFGRLKLMFSTRTHWTIQGSNSVKCCRCDWSLHSNLTAATLRKPWQINQLKPSPENQPRFPRDLKRWSCPGAQPAEASWPSGRGEGPERMVPPWLDSGFFSGLRTIESQLINVNQTWHWVRRWVELQVQDAFAFRRKFYIVMEYVNGTDLGRSGGLRVF